MKKFLIRMRTRVLLTICTPFLPVILALLYFGKPDEELGKPTLRDLLSIIKEWFWYGIIKGDY